MKLIKKVNQQYIAFSILVLTIIGISIYFIIKSIVYEETDEKLVNTFNQIVNLENKQIYDLELYPSISIAKDFSNSIGRSFKDTTLKVMDEMEEYRQLNDYATIQGTKYKITVRASILESEDLFETLILVIFSGFIFLLFLLIIINKRVANTIWHPFFGNLEKLKQFSLQDLKPISLDSTNINEFEELNSVLKTLTTKVISDYENLKKFSENASHELQTPLAIIRSKVEALLNENQFNTNQTEKIQAIHKTVNKLTKINRGLLLLTKIENNQYSEQETIDINEVIETHIQNFTELFELKEISLQYKCESQWKITGNKTLVDILINNLLGNAIVHNSHQGTIHIKLSNGLLEFSNTSQSEIIDKAQLFERFFKGAGSSTTGLGLAISKQICNTMGLTIEYNFENNMNKFVVREASL